MEKILFVNACVRGYESRTLSLAEGFISKLGVPVKMVNLCTSDIHPLLGQRFYKREELVEAGNYDDEMFKYAKDFKEADKIIVAAPFWELSFPSILKVYIENVSVKGLTFNVSYDGLKGCCKAKKLLYITTRGGTYTDTDLELGASHMKALCKFFGINEFIEVSVDGLDEDRFPVEELLKPAREKLSELAKNF